MALYTYFSEIQIVRNNAKKIAAFIFSILIFLGSTSSTFAAWTDNPLQAGSTVMKAIHLQEIRDMLSFDKKCPEGKSLQGFDEEQNAICVEFSLKNITELDNGNVGIGTTSPKAN